MTHKVQAGKHRAAFRSQLQRASNVLHVAIEFELLCRIQTTCSSLTDMPFDRDPTHPGGVPSTNSQQHDRSAGLCWLRCTPRTRRLLSITLDCRHDLDAALQYAIGFQSFIAQGIVQRTHCGDGKLRTPRFPNMQCEVN